MPPGRVRQGGGDAEHEGMEGWTRERDNRMRELSKKREEDGGLAPDEEDEYQELRVDNEKFIEAGLKFQRGEGINKWDSIVVLLGYAIGLGNLWRFPYLVGKFGGLSFLIAYFVCLIFIAHPVYLLELAWGQTMRKSTVFAMMEIGRRWTGVGYACVLALVLVQSYYTVLLAYCCVYIAHSFSHPLPWSIEALPEDAPNMTAAEYYWKTTLLGQELGPDGEEIDTSLGSVQWPLVVGLLVSYCIIFAAVFKGIKAEARVTYFTVGSPMLLLLVLLVRALILPGAGEGIKFYLGRFDVISFVNPVMWAEACSQTLFTLLFLPGTSITLASYMQSKEDIYRISQIVLGINTGFSLLSGLVVFAILGNLSHELCHTGGENECRSVDDVAKASGAGLAFVALAEGITSFGAGQNFFSVIFFLMSLALGLDTTFAGVETLVTYIEDFCIYIGREKIKRELITTCCVILLFLLGLLFCTSNGFTLLDIVDHYVTTYLMLVVCALECVMLRMDVTWDVLATRVQLSTTGLLYINNGRGRVLPGFIQTCLGWVAPVACVGLALTLFIFDCVNPYGPADGGSYTAGWQAIGWVLMMVYLSVIPLGGWYSLRYSIQPPQTSGTKEMDDKLLDQEAPVCHVNSERGEEYQPPPVATGKTAAMRKELERLGEGVLSEAALTESQGSSRAHTPTTEAETK